MLSPIGILYDNLIFSFYAFNHKCIFFGKINAFNICWSGKVISIFEWRVEKILVIINSSNIMSRPFYPRSSFWKKYESFVTSILVLSLMVICLSPLTQRPCGISRSSWSLAEKLMITGHLSRKTGLVDRLPRYYQKVWNWNSQ